MSTAATILSAAAVGAAAVIGGLTYASIAPENTLWGPVVAHGDRSAPARCALTFDDGPTEPWTSKVLDELRAMDVKAAFFVIGRNVESAPDVLRRINAEGHLIGNHSYDHWHFGMTRRRRYWDHQIAATDELIEKTIGTRPNIFRPPMGVRTWHITAAAHDYGHKVVTWSHRARDGIKTTPERIIARLVPPARGGDIMLLHDGIEPYMKRDPRPSIACLRPLIEQLRGRGIEPVRLDQLMETSA